MPWFRLDDGFHNHPKVRSAGNAATGLWVRCATYSAQYMTDGHVAADTALGYGTRREIDRLVAAGLWLPNGTGFLIPDYLEYNHSAAEIRARRAETAANKRAGGLARAQSARRDEHGRML